MLFWYSDYEYTISPTVQRKTEIVYHSTDEWNKFPKEANELVIFLTLHLTLWA